jgi:hypothetical protein
MVSLVIYLIGSDQLFSSQFLTFINMFLTPSWRHWTMDICPETWRRCLHSCRLSSSSEKLEGKIYLRFETCNLLQKSGLPGNCRWLFFGCWNWCEYHLSRIRQYLKLTYPVFLISYLTVFINILLVIMAIILTAHLWKFFFFFLYFFGGSAFLNNISWLCLWTLGSLANLNPNPHAFSVHSWPDGVPGAQWPRS